MLQQSNYEVLLAELIADITAEDESLAFGLPSEPFDISQAEQSVTGFLEKLEYARLVDVFLSAPTAPTYDDIWAPTPRGIMEKVVFWIVIDELDDLTSEIDLAF